MKNKYLYVNPWLKKRLASEITIWAIQAALVAIIATILIVVAIKVIKEPREQVVNEHISEMITYQPSNVFEFTELKLEPEHEYEQQIEKLEPIEFYFNQEDLVAVAKCLWGEARGCTFEEQCKVVWVICNRMDHGFGKSIYDVVTAPHQFHGYSSENPVTDEQLEIALYVLNIWSAEKQGFEVERLLGPDYLYFFGDGTQNHFRTEWTGE